MKIRLIYPKWSKLAGQREFHLPPHGPVVFAAAVPEEHELLFTDENIDQIDLDEKPDLVCLSMMLTCQTPRGFEVADHFRARGVPVICGGIAAALHVDECAAHCDAVFVGEVEGRVEGLLEDLRLGRLKKVYDHLTDPVPIELVGTARRSILNRPAYRYRGVQMVDLVHASRGCRFNCYPCCVSYLGGRSFRPRPIDKVVAEVESIPNNRLFFVDNSLAQDKQWELDLFKALAPLKRAIISHPVQDDDDVLRAAADAGLWWVYQAVFDTSDVIRQRIRRYRDHGIGVEGTIILGTDDHDQDTIKRLVDFLLEVELDLAEFTIMTPFAETPVRRQLEAQGRLLTDDPAEYTCDRVVFRPARMTPDELQGMYAYAWDTFYGTVSQEQRMAELFVRVARREIADGTYRRPSRRRRRREATR